MPNIAVLVESPEVTKRLGERIGQQLRGGEVIELVSDLGGGKTTFVSGLSQGFGSSDPVASPSFTISYVYGRSDGKQLYHFDFYRLTEAGVVASELAEVVEDPNVVVAVEWGEIVHDVLPESRITLTIKAKTETERQLEFNYPKKYGYLFRDLKGKTQ